MGARGRVMAGAAAILLACSPTRGADDVDGSGRRARSPVPEKRRGIAFTDVTQRVSAGTSPHRTWGAAWVDHDSNGFPDLFVVRHWADPQLLLNEGGTYQRGEVDAFANEPFDRHACAWGEANGDGAPDLYCVQGADKGAGAGPNGLWLQGDDGFTDVAAKAGVEDRLGRGRSLNWLDYDGDDDLDIFVGNHLRAAAPNRLFRNDGGNFTRVEVGVEDHLATISSSWADWDRDGDPDLLVLQYGTGGPVAYENRGGRFERTELKGVADATWRSATWGHADSDARVDLHLVSRTRSVVLRNVRNRFRVLDRTRLRQGRMSAWLDVENDGDMDLYIVQGARGENYRPSESSRDARDLLLINEGRSFAPMGLPPPADTRDGNGDAVAVADGDRDGFVDVFVTHGHLYWRGISTLLRNVSRGSRWAAIDLQGGDRNPLGVGAELEVEAGNLRYFRYVGDGFDFRAQSEIGYVPLGLGRAQSAHVEISWSDGTSDCFGVAAGDIFKISPGDEPCAETGD